MNVQLERSVVSLDSCYISLKSQVCAKLSAVPRYKHSRTNTSSVVHRTPPSFGITHIFRLRCSLVAPTRLFDMCPTLQRTIKLFNNSDIKVAFELKTLSSAMEERSVRMDRLLELEESADDVSDLRIRRRIIDEDPLVFEHPVFSIEPVRGELFPGSFIELTVTFKPATAGEVSATAHCEVTGREGRLPIQLVGTGVGPRATWLYDSLDVGDVYINSQHRYVGP